jgi:hypothetical protein
MKDKIYTIAEIQDLVSPIAKRYGVDRMLILAHTLVAKQLPKVILTFVWTVTLFMDIFNLQGFMTV